MQVASFLLYLTDVSEGGETMFPFEVSLSLLIFTHIPFTNLLGRNYALLFCRMASTWMVGMISRTVLV